MAKYKYILTVIITLCTLITYAQPAQYTPMTAAGYQMKRLKVDSTLHLPSFCGVPTLRGSSAKEGALAIDTCGGFLFIWTNENGWDTIGGSGGGGSSTDTTSLSNRINLKVDSIRRVSDSVFAWINGVKFFQFKDSVGGGIGGSGTQYFVPKWSASTTLQNSQIFDSVNVGINTTTPAYNLDVNGTGRFVNDLYADEDFIVNNYFAINTTATDFPIPNGTLGIWRRKGNGFGTKFLEDEQGFAKDKWAFVKRQGYDSTREWFQTNSSIVNINYGWGNPNSSNYEGNTLLIDPTIRLGKASNSNTKIRGIYYNPTLDSLVNTTHIAFESTSGNVVMKGLKTSSSTTDSIAIWINDTLSKAPYPTGETASTVFQNEIHVSKDGSDVTGDGTLLKPYATITQGLTLVAGTRKTIVLHPGSYSESPNITVQYTVITTFELLGGNTEIVGTVSTSTGCTISGIKMTNLTISNLTGTGNVNVLNCDISGTLSKSSTGDYTLIRFCDIGTTSITSSAGTVAIFGGNPNFITVNNAGARVVVKNCTTVAPVLTAGSLSLVDCIIFAITGTSNAYTAAAGTFSTLANSQLIVPTFTNFARVSIAGFYSIINTVYDRASSTLTGTSTNSIVNSQFINADKFIKQGGTSSQFLKADGSVDSLTYLSASDTISLSNRINLKLNISDTSTFQRKSIPSYTFLANNTTATANAQALTFKDTSGTYTGTPTWSSSAPTGATNHSYRWTRIGNMVTLNISLVYSTVSGANTTVLIPMPSDAPTPTKPAGVTAASNFLYPAYFNSGNTLTAAQISGRGGIRSNSGNNAFEIFVTFGSLQSIYFEVTVTYYTN